MCPIVFGTKFYNLYVSVAKKIVLFIAHFSEQSVTITAMLDLNEYVHLLQKCVTMRSQDDPNPTINQSRDSSSHHPLCMNMKMRFRLLENQSSIHAPTSQQNEDRRQFAYHRRYRMHRQRLF
ncbi:hypothetical protein NS319_03600 [Sphingomonas sanguinis]|uniref:Uncharacterized protein n=1 Tax=Sphingomonas sanguinis TaxID=33051 RepID=A0A147I489_9SPHN|nr:hypothetical protein NS319_03600 [Sphingomonas sanguinis]